MILLTMEIEIYRCALQEPQIKVVRNHIPIYPHVEGSIYPYVEAFKCLSRENPATWSTFLPKVMLHSNA